MAYFITDTCIGCTVCELKCPVDTISGKSKELYVIHPEGCIDCGVCAICCPVSCIQDQYGNLVTRISGETGLTQQQVFDVVQKTLDYIAEALAKGDKVELRNFGVFEIKIRKARVGRNPNKPEADVAIPARATVKFKAGKEMRIDVLKLTPKA